MIMITTCEIECWEQLMVLTSSCPCPHRDSNPTPSSDKEQEDRGKLLEVDQPGRASLRRCTAGRIWGKSRGKGSPG